MSTAFKNFERRLDDVLEDQELDHYSIGVLWNELSHQHYAEKELGQTASAWWKAHAGGFCDVRTAKRRGRVARRYHREVMAAEGDNRLDLLILYCEHRDDPIPADPRPFPIEFKDAAGNKFTKPFSDCSEQEMEWAVRPPGHHPKRKPPPPPPPPSKKTPPPPPVHTGGPGYWETTYLGIVTNALDKIGEETGKSWTEHGACFEWAGDTPVFSVRRIAWEHIPQLVKILAESRAKAIEQGSLVPLPTIPPVPDWLKGT